MKEKNGREKKKFKYFIQNDDYDDEDVKHKNITGNMCVYFIFLFGYFFLHFFFYRKNKLKFI